MIMGEMDLIDLEREEDAGDEVKKSIRVTVHQSCGRLFIRPEGYGDASSYNGEGDPIMVELYGGELRVILWSDINQEDSTHIISMEDAQENRRGEALPTTLADELSKMDESDLAIILEAAIVSLSDGEVYDSIVDKLDLSDEAAKEVQEKLTDIMQK